MAHYHHRTPDVIQRRAINLSGVLGSPYDATRDQIIGVPIMPCIEKHSPLRETPTCKLVKGKTSESNNLLQTIGIENELRLSLLLNFARREGVAKVLDHPVYIDEHTRFLYYSWIQQESRLEIVSSQYLKIVQTIFPYSNATHIVTGIRYGIDFLAVIQLLPQVNVERVDSMLQKISDKFRRGSYTISYDIIESLTSNITVTIYSNIPTLNYLYDLFQLFTYTCYIQKSLTFCYPSTYILQSISSLYQVYMKKTIAFKTLSSDLINRIERCMLLLRTTVIHARFMLEEIEIVLENTFDHSKQFTDQLCKRFCTIEKEYIKKKDDLTVLVIQTRSNRISDHTVAEALHENELISLMVDVKKLILDLERFKEIYSSAVHLEVLRLDCCNPGQYCLDQRDNITDETKRLIKKDSDHFVSSLNIKPNRSLPSMEDVTNQNVNRIDCMDDHQSICQPSSKENRPPLSVSSPTIEKTTNILLMGETGVGKSTFINAFANYIAFNSLEQAKSNEPIVIIPVSFILTTGDNFDEKIIKFGEIDSLNNENFNDIGQSVTQHCKSYVFNIGKSDKKLRIIDTPGFGDTRGLEQDDQNIEHILHYVNNLSHLNAICFLFKPNSQRLNICFRTCFNQIFSFLDPSAKKNIIFCFTNGRSTFYTPGDTAPLLKTMLNSLSIKDIPFGKENAFCFDSEAFRYLVALRNDIPFSDAAEREYQQSWSVSVKESERFVNYIAKQTAIDLTNREWQSVKHAQFQILYMIRPLLETIRNILRNIIICENNKTTQFIELCAKSVCPKTTHCHSCKEEPKLVGDFWILHYRMHEIQDNKCTCSCSPDKHIRVNYTLEYRMVRNISDYKKEELTKILEILCTVSAKFANFLGYSKDDPFTIGLERMIDEEKYILEKHNQAHFNRKLLDKLQELKYQSNHEHITLVDIYEMIEQINKYPMIAEQMKAVKETQTKMMNQYEYEPQKI
mgnify:FL=1